MEELIELLEEIQPDADFENCDTITPADIIPENFNSAKALWDMVCRLKG